eukprot:30294-Pelagococcus_subviridis.AAC.108
MRVSSVERVAIWCRAIRTQTLKPEHAHVASRNVFLRVFLQTGAKLPSKTPAVLTVPLSVRARRSRVALAKLRLSSRRARHSSDPPPPPPPLGTFADTDSPLNKSSSSTSQPSPAPPPSVGGGTYPGSVNSDARSSFAAGGGGGGNAPPPPCPPIAEPAPPKPKLPPTGFALAGGGRSGAIGATTGVGGARVAGVGVGADVASDVDAANGSTAPPLEPAEVCDGAAEGAEGVLAASAGASLSVGIRPRSTRSIIDRMIFVTTASCFLFSPGASMSGESSGMILDAVRTSPAAADTRSATPATHINVAAVASTFNSRCNVDSVESHSGGPKPSHTFPTVTSAFTRTAAAVVFSAVAWSFGRMSFFTAAGVTLAHAAAVCFSASSCTLISTSSIPLTTAPMTVRSNVSRVVTRPASVGTARRIASSASPDASTSTGDNAGSVEAVKSSGL